MGNSQGSSKPDYTNVDEMIHNIANQYLRGIGNFDMINLLDVSKCNRITILTGKAIEKMVENSEIVNNQRGNIEEVFVLNKDDMYKSVDESVGARSSARYEPPPSYLDWINPRKKRDHTNTSREKKLKCANVAEKYVKIFHLFAAIRFAVLDIDTTNFRPISSDIVDGADYASNHVSKQRNDAMGDRPTLKNSCRKRLVGLLEEQPDNSPPTTPFKHLDDYMKIMQKDAKYDNGKFINTSSKELETDAQTLAEIYSSDSSGVRDFTGIERNRNPPREPENMTRDDVRKKIEEANKRHVGFANELMGILRTIFVTDKTGKSFQIKRHIDLYQVNKLIQQARKIILNMEGNCEKDYDEIVHAIERLNEKKKSVTRGEGETDASGEGETDADGTNDAFPTTTTTTHQI
jgi:hypothetical protein